MRPLLALLSCAVAVLLSPLPAHAAEHALTDRDGLRALLRTPTDAPDPAKTYWLVVSVHGVSANATHGLALLADWTLPEDVILLAPTFAPPAEPGRAGWKNSYQMSAPAHVEKLHTLIADVGETWKLHPKFILNGFSAGAQFAHRYAMLHPERLAAVAAHSGGSWAKLDGDDRINPAARPVPFAISCGEADAKRLVAAREFSSALQTLAFTVDFQTWPEVAHTFSPAASAQTLSLLNRVRAAGPTPTPAN